MKNTFFLFAKAIFVFAVFISSVFGIQNEMPLARQNLFRAEAENRTKISIENFSFDEREIFVLINRERRKRRLAELQWNDDLADMARKYSEKMADENFFSHFDVKGANVARRAQKARIKGWSKIGENLFTIENAVEFDAFAVKAWMNSPSHRLNILDKDWTESGIGIAQSENGDIYVTQVFIKR